MENKIDSDKGEAEECRIPMKILEDMLESVQKNDL